jgi:glyceraldehyde 3-phosphate dehydrogenase
VSEPLRIGINGFGRIGRLALRAGWDRDDISFLHVNELHGGATPCAHLLEFDSVHGRWARGIQAVDDALAIDGIPVGLSRAAEPGAVSWGERGVDIVLECTGRFRSEATLAPYFHHGVFRVVVAAPVRGDEALNLVLGVNEGRFDAVRHRIVTAASCTTTSRRSSRCCTRASGSATGRSRRCTTSRTPRQFSMRRTRIYVAPALRRSR